MPSGYSSLRQVVKKIKDDEYTVSLNNDLKCTSVEYVYLFSSDIEIGLLLPNHCVP